MNKINFEEFKRECKKLQGRNICIKISKIIETTKKINDAQIVINSNRILISGENSNEININPNYISNFYQEQEMLKCELDNWLEVLIYKVKE